MSQEVAGGVVLEGAGGCLKRSYLMMQARRRVSIFGGAVVKKIIIFIPMRVP